MKLRQCGDVRVAVYHVDVVWTRVGRWWVWNCKIPGKRITHGCSSSVRVCWNCTRLFPNSKHRPTLSVRLLILFLCWECFLVGVTMETTSGCLVTRDAVPQLPRTKLVTRALRFSSPPYPMFHHPPPVFSLPLLPPRLKPRGAKTHHLVKRRRKTTFVLYNCTGDEYVLLIPKDDFLCWGRVGVSSPYAIPLPSSSASFAPVTLLVSLQGSFRLYNKETILNSRCQKVKGRTFFPCIISILDSWY